MEDKNNLVGEALEEGRNRYHELAEDHWSYQCSELAPCIFCQAITVNTAMLEALERVAECCDKEPENTCVSCGHLARAAIAQARKVRP